MSRIDIHHRWAIRAWLASHLPGLYVEEDFRGLILEWPEEESPRGVPLAPDERSRIRIYNDRTLASYNAGTGRRYHISGPKGRVGSGSYKKSSLDEWSECGGYKYEHSRSTGR